MPKRTRKTHKKEPSAPSAASKKKITAIAEDTERESIESLLDDFDIQTATLKKQSLKQFEKEAKLMLSAGALPQKSSIPKEVLKMDISEFICRGGSFQSVWESLKNEKHGQGPLESLIVEDAQKNTAPVETGETSGLAGNSGSCSEAQSSSYVTPAMSTRSLRARTKRGQTTAKRKPKPLEEVKVQAFSNASGSPVDEKMLLQLHSSEVIVDVQEKIMEACAVAKFPQKWRSKLVQTFRELKAHSGMQNDVLITPASRR